VLAIDGLEGNPGKADLQIDFQLRLAAGAFLFGGGDGERDAGQVQVDRPRREDVLLDQQPIGKISAVFS
jgi:hypothetical protein